MNQDFTPGLGLNSQLLDDTERVPTTRPDCANPINGMNGYVVVHYSVHTDTPERTGDAPLA